MMDTIKRIDDVQNKLEAIKNMPEPSNWELEEVFTCARALFSFSKFKKGQTVSLKSTPEITEETNFGWLGYKEFLVVGAKGVVDSVYWFRDAFNYWVYIKCDKNFYLFTFREEELE